MLDVVKLLNAPPPWEPHGSSVPLPDRYQALLDYDAVRARAFFVATGPVAPAAGQSRAAALGIGGDDLEATPKLRVLRVKTLAEVQAAVDEAIASGSPHRLVIGGAISCDRGLRIDRANQLVLDLTNLRIDVAMSHEPLVILQNSRKIAVRGLKVTQVHKIAIEITTCEDIDVSGAVVSGAFGAGILLTGGSKRVLIDRSIFVRNAGVSVKAMGEVANVVILQSQFDGPTAVSFIHLAEAKVALGYAALNPDEPGRDALTHAHPTDIRILENRFGRTDAVAILAEGTRGVWVERNDFNGAAGGAVCSIGHCAGIMVADNRIAPLAKTAAPLVAINDTAFFCIFRNIFEPISQESIRVSGQFGGGFIASNSVLAPKQDVLTGEDGKPVPVINPDAGIVLDPGTTDEAFWSTTLMLNIVRGAFRVGIEITGALPRLFLFDNHMFGMTAWSLKSDVVQPMLTSLNNWSLDKSMNIPLSQVPIESARVFWAAIELEDDEVDAEIADLPDGFTVVPAGHADVVLTVVSADASGDTSADTKVKKA